MKRFKRVTTVILLVFHLVFSILWAWCIFVMHFPRVSDFTDLLLTPFPHINLSTEAEWVIQYWAFGSLSFLLGITLILWLLQIRGRSLSYATLLLAPIQVVFYAAVGYFTSSLRREECTNLIILLVLPILLALNVGLDIWEIVRLTRRRTPEIP